MSNDPPVSVFSLVETLPCLRLAPPIIAILLAIVLKDVNFALLLATLSGCLLIAELDLFSALDKFCEVMAGQVADSDHRRGPWQHGLESTRNSG